MNVIWRVLTVCRLRQRRNFCNAYHHCVCVSKITPKFVEGLRRKFLSGWTTVGLGKCGYPLPGNFKFCLRWIAFRAVTTGIHPDYSRIQDWNSVHDHRNPALGPALFSEICALGRWLQLRFNFNLTVLTSLRLSFVVRLLITRHNVNKVTYQLPLTAMRLRPKINSSIGLTGLL